MFSLGIIVLLVFSLFQVSSVCASSSHTPAHRRHHAKLAAPLVRSISQRSSNCSDGAWMCNGSDLSQCSYGAWIFSQTCSGGTVCSATGGVVGCVWPYQVQQALPSATTTILSSEALPSATSSSSSGTSVAAMASSVSFASSPSTTTPSSTGASSSYSAEVSSITASSTSSAAVSTSSAASSSSSFKWVVYSDAWIGSSLPTPSDLGSVNVFILAFWMTSSGAVDNALVWSQMSSSDRASLKAQYDAAGISLMVSAFGSTDNPTTSGADPTTVANDLATFVKNNSLSGVDIDYEDFTAMNGGTATAWLITFQTALRAALGDSYIITHAPVAPWFSSSYTDDGYLGVYQSAGSGIDWFNIQFYSEYHQGAGTYDTCQELIVESGSSFPNTAVAQLVSAGVPASKIVIGKPATTASASNGFMTAALLGACLLEAKNEWSDIGGAMLWEWDSAGTVDTFVTNALAVINA